DGVVPGDYRVTANLGFASSQMNLYVKEIRFGSTDVLNNAMVVTGPTSDALEVVFGKDAGQVGGTVRGDSQQLVTVFRSFSFPISASGTIFISLRLRIQTVSSSSPRCPWVHTKSLLRRTSSGFHGSIPQFWPDTKHTRCLSLSVRLRM